LLKKLRTHSGKAQMPLLPILNIFSKSSPLI